MDVVILINLRTYSNNRVEEKNESVVIPLAIFFFFF